MSAETFTPEPRTDNPDLTPDPDVTGNTEPGTTDPDSESLTTTPETTAETQEEDARDPYILVAGAAERLAAWLRSRSEAKNERQETQEDDETEARIFIVRIGKKVLESLKATPVVTAGLESVSDESGTTTDTEVRDDVVVAAKSAKDRLAERVAAYKKRREEKAYDRMRDQANAMNDDFDDDIAFEAEETARLEAEERENQERETRAALLIEKARLEKKIEAARIAQKASAAKAARRTKRRETFADNARMQSRRAELWTKTKGLGRRFGRAALRTYKRTRAAASAGRDAWNQTS